MRKKKRHKKPRSEYEIYMAVLRGERLKGKEFYIYYRYRDNKYNRRVNARSLLLMMASIEKARKFLGHPEIEWNKISKAARSK